MPPALLIAALAVAAAPLSIASARDLRAESPLCCIERIAVGVTGVPLNNRADDAMDDGERASDDNAPAVLLPVPVLMPTAVLAV